MPLSREELICRAARLCIRCRKPALRLDGKLECAACELEAEGAGGDAGDLLEHPHLRRP